LLILIWILIKNQKTENDIIKQQILHEFIKTVEDKADEASKNIYPYTIEANKISKQLKDAKKSSQKCCGHAKWIGVEWYDN
jgi:hypothetical protein